MNEQFVFNGIDGVTGDYLVPPIGPDDFAVPSFEREVEADHLAELSWRVRQRHDATFAPIEGVDAKDLAEAGWGIVLAADDDPAVEAALEPLIAHRRSQAGARFKRLVYRPGESKQDFLARNNAGPGPADPDRVPYYLMLVGDPIQIPYRFQYQLDVQYAIGRIHFDHPRDYATYAESVVRAESAVIARPGRATFFGTASPGDQATQLSSAELLRPLAQAFAELESTHAVSSVIGDLATKDRLQKILADAPTLLFTASHGVGFPAGHPSQLAQQGGLLCQDWPGPGSGPISPSWCFGGEDVDPDADLTGMIAFHFACYSAGTPEWDDYAHRIGRDPRRIAPRAFLAALPKRLLANPGGAALAVVGHVDRAWGYSFAWPSVGRQTAVFESCLHRLVDGHPVASALEYFNDRYAELSSDLTVELEDVRYGKVPDALDLAAMWTANNDARAFALIGDPAVTLARTIASEPPGSGLGREIDTTHDGGAEPEAPDRRTAGALADDLMAVIAHLGEIEVTTSEGEIAGSSDRRPLLRTRLGLDGTGSEAIVAPGLDGGEQLWRLHAATVEQAIAARGELVRALPALLASLRATATPDTAGGRTDDH